MANLYPNPQAQYNNIEVYNAQPPQQGGRPVQFGPRPPPHASNAYPPGYYASPNAGYMGWNPQPGASPQCPMPHPTNGYCANPGFPQQNYQTYPLFNPNDFPDHEKIFLDENSSVQIRHAFIRKVYGILSVQLLISFSIILATHFVSAFKHVIRAFPILFFISLIGAFALLLIVTCFSSISRRFPWNIYLIFAISALLGICISYSTVYIDTLTLLEAVGLTTVLVLAITIFAFQTRIDFTGLGVYFFVGGLALMVLGIVSIFIRNSIFRLVVAYLGAVFFTFATIYDTQLIVGGKRKQQYSIDDYVLASLTLYLDIINLFQYILQILNNSSDS